jgi:hypothetical protein
MGVDWGGEKGGVSWSEKQGAVFDADSSRRLFISDVDELDVLFNELSRIHDLRGLPRWPRQHTWLKSPCQQRACVVRVCVEIRRHTSTNRAWTCIIAREKGRYAKLKMQSSACAKIMGVCMPVTYSTSRKTNSARIRSRWDKMFQRTKNGEGTYIFRGVAGVKYT